MRQQVQEMLRIEKGGEEQIPGELAAYNPLIPQGDELIATLMFEIDDPQRRARVLAAWAASSDKPSSASAARSCAASPKKTRTARRGRQGLIGAVHALSLHAGRDRRVPRRRGRVVVGFGHPNYAHMAVMPAAVRAGAGADFA